MFRSKISSRVALLVERVDSFEDLIKDQECLLLAHSFLLDVCRERSSIRFSDKSNYILTRYLLLDFEEMLRVEQDLGLAEDAAIELEAFCDVELIDGVISDELDVEGIAVVWVDALYDFYF